MPVTITEYFDAISDASLTERINERAAIMEYDGNLPRIQAETLADQTERARAAMFQQGKARD